MKKWILILCILTMTGAAIAAAPKMTLAEKPEMKYIGVPVKSVNWVHTHLALDGRGDPCALITMGQQGDNFVLLRVNLKTGDQRQFNAQIKQSNYPTGTLMSRSGLLYIGASYSGHLFAFDAKKDQLADLGAINPGKAEFACGIDEDADGRIWIGSYGTADLTAFDPKTGEFTRFGRMDDVDMYCYPLVNADGMICNRIMMTQPRLVVLDPKTGEKKQVGPVAVKGKDTFDLVKDEGGRVLHQIEPGQFPHRGVQRRRRRQGARKDSSGPVPRHPVGEARRTPRLLRAQAGGHLRDRRNQNHRPERDPRRHRDLLSPPRAGQPGLRLEHPAAARAALQPGVGRTGRPGFASRRRGLFDGQSRRQDLHPGLHRGDPVGLRSVQTLSLRQGSRQQPARSRPHGRHLLSAALDPRRPSRPRLGGFDSRLRHVGRPHLHL